MLLSLTKILLFILIVVFIAAGLAYLLDSKDVILGNVQATISGTEYTLTPVQVVLFLVAFSFMIWLILKIFSFLVSVMKFINGDDTAILRYFNRNRERKGFQALSDGMLALASGEGQLAMDKATRAARFLNQPSLTNVLAAQAAELSGNRQKATEIYKTLVQLPETRFVGVRGLLKQKLEDGNIDVALKLAETAFAIKPKHEEVQDTLLQLQAKTQNWDGARKTLRTKLKHGSLPRDVHKRRDAVLALSQAKGVLEDGQTVEARENAIEANRLSPDLVPAAAMAARSYIENAKPKYAIRVIQKAWQAQPHPDLAAVFSEISPEETPVQRLKRFETLRKLAPDHRETKLAMAELYLSSEDFKNARKELESLLEIDPDARVFTIMAAIERGEGRSDELVRGWLAKALGARRGPQWTCDNCQTAHPTWTPVCESCEAFDTLTWKAPLLTGISSSTGLEMLPLLMGQENKSDAEDIVLPRTDISPPVKDFSDQDFEMPQPDVEPKDDLVAPIEK
jgi:HemY protein